MSILWHDRVFNMVRAGDPREAEALDDTDAERVVAEQDGLDLENFLASVPRL